MGIAINDRFTLMSDPVFGLPSTWARVDSETLDHGLRQARRALDPSQAVPALSAYFDEDSNYAGALFNTIEHAAADPGPDNRVTPGDLLAVATLSMDIGPLQARQLLTSGQHANRESRRLLALIPATVPLSEVGSRMNEPADPGTALLSHMSDLQDTLRETGKRRKNDDSPRNWVFASKLTARKRPILFPVRDNVVCRYLSPTGQLRARGAGNFRHDIQVFAHIAADPDVSHTIHTLRHEAKVPSAVPDLRILDAALWMASPR